MKRFLILCSFLSLVVATMFAQQADFQKAVAHFKKYTETTATVTKTTHKNAVVGDVVDKGTLTMTRPATVTISTNGGKDQLLMEGSKFTMVVKGRKHTTSSKSNTQFASFQVVFESLLSGGEKDIAQLSDLVITRQGQQLVLTITPKAESKKAARRMLFSSLVLTFDTKASELRSLRMNERAGYTEYTFTGYKYK